MNHNKGEEQKNHEDKSWGEAEGGFGLRLECRQWQLAASLSSQFASYFQPGKPGSHITTVFVNAFSNQYVSPKVSFPAVRASAANSGEVLLFCSHVPPLSWGGVADMRQQLLLTS